MRINIVIAKRLQTDNITRLIGEIHPECPFAVENARCVVVHGGHGKIAHALLGLVKGLHVTRYMGLKLQRLEFIFQQYRYPGGGQGLGQTDVFHLRQSP